MARKGTLLRGAPSTSETATIDSLFSGSLADKHTALQFATTQLNIPLLPAETGKAIVLAVLANISQSRINKAQYINSFLPTIRRNSHKIKAWGIEPEVVGFLQAALLTTVMPDDIEATLAKFDAKVGRPLYLRERVGTIRWASIPDFAKQQKDLPEFCTVGSPEDSESHLEIAVSPPLPSGTQILESRPISAKEQVLLNERGLLLEELFQSETEFFTSMRFQVELWEKPCRASGILSDTEVDQVFSVSEQLRDFHLLLLKELKRNARDTHPRPLDGGSVERIVRVLKLNLNIINTYQAALPSAITSLAEKLQNPAVFNWFRDQREIAGSPLAKCYPLVLQRYQQYEAVWRDILYYSTGTDREAIDDLLVELSPLSQQLLQCSDHVAQLLSLLELDLHVINKRHIFARPGHYLLKSISHCHAKLGNLSDKVYNLFILSDSLLFALPEGPHGDWRIVVFCYFQELTSASIAVEIRGQKTFFRFKAKVDEQENFEICARGASEDETTEIISLIRHEFKRYQQERAIRRRNTLTAADRAMFSSKTTKFN